MPNAFERALQDTERHFASPNDILDNHEFSREQKIKLLKNWDYTLRLKLVASEESMTGPEPEGSTSEKLRRVGKALEQLGYSDDQPDGPSKTGA